MRYYSTNNKDYKTSLKSAVIKGLAPDRGLYMPETIPTLPQEFFDEIGSMTFQEVSFIVVKAIFGENIPEDKLKSIVYDTLSFDCPIVEVEDSIYSLELYHGPTLAFKDVGARFMARMLSHFASDEAQKQINVLVATSGDTGSAVANGFLGVPGIHVYVLYPSGKVSKIQESQFTTLGRNITALEIKGNFDDCQALVKNAFMDKGLNETLYLTSANSINVARFLPQMFYYFWAYAQLVKRGITDGIVISVPSGNFGNITAALMAYKMGLPIKRFIAANNANDVFYQYLKTGSYKPTKSKQTIANAMDVGDPSNMARILDLFGHDHRTIASLISGSTFSDDEIREAMLQCYQQTGYILDPHGACGYRALKESLRQGETGVFCETAHPAKFKETVDSAIDISIPLPGRLEAFTRGQKDTVILTNDYEEFKSFLLSDEHNK